MMSKAWLNHDQPQGLDALLKDDCRRRIDTQTPLPLLFLIQQILTKKLNHPSFLLSLKELLVRLKEEAQLPKALRALEQSQQAACSQVPTKNTLKEYFDNKYWLHLASLAFSVSFQIFFSAGGSLCSTFYGDTRHFKIQLAYHANQYYIVQPCDHFLQQSTRSQPLTPQFKRVGSFSDISDEFFTQKKCFSDSRLHNAFPSQLGLTFNLTCDTNSSTETNFTDDQEEQENSIGLFDTWLKFMQQIQDPKMFEVHWMSQDYSSTSATRFTGRLKFFDESKKYGFIVIDQDGSDIFVHQQDMLLAGISKQKLKCVRSQQVRFSFDSMRYFGKYKQSKKAVNLILLQPKINSLL